MEERMDEPVVITLFSVSYDRDCAITVRLNDERYYSYLQAAPIGNTKQQNLAETEKVATYLRELISQGRMNELETTLFRQACGDRLYVRNAEGYEAFQELLSNHKAAIAAFIMERKKEEYEYTLKSLTRWMSR